MGQKQDDPRLRNCNHVLRGWEKDPKEVFD
jgi:hypothetical protein